MSKEERIEANLENGKTEVEVCSHDFGQFIANIVDMRIDVDGSTIYTVCDQDDQHFDVDEREIETLGDKNE